MGFDAGTVVEKLDYDFTAFGGGSGTIPEPSQKAVETYQKEITKAIQQLSGLPGVQDDFNMAELNALMNQVEDVDLEKIGKDIKKAMAKLCSNTPSVKEMDMLPYRVFQAFQQWLQKELSPEAESAGTTPSLRVVPGA